MLTPHRTGGDARNTEKNDIEHESRGPESPEKNVGEKIGRRRSDRARRRDLGPAQKGPRELENGQGTGERPREPGTASGASTGLRKRERIGERPRGAAWELMT